MNEEKLVLEKHLTEKIISAAIQVHRHLGPGLLESIYEECLCKEFRTNQITYERQKDLPVAYMGETLPFHYRLDLLVENKVILEIKCVEQILRIHQAQLLTYMKPCKVRVGLILNFNVPILRFGIKRLVL